MRRSLLLLTTIALLMASAPARGQAPTYAFDVFGAYLDSLGWAYYKLGNYEMAEESLRRAMDHISKDPTVHDHMGEVYAKTGRLKLAVAQWERAIEEWNRSLPADVETNDVARVQKQLESTKVKLARQEGAK